MNREEILERSRKETHNSLDEREKSIETKANSISQGVGMILCIVMGAIGLGLSGSPNCLWCAVAICWGMFACERLVVAVRTKTPGAWLLAGIITVGAVAVTVAYILNLIGIV